MVDTETLARYLGVSQRTVRHYSAAKGLPKLRFDAYDLAAVRLWEIGQVRKELEARQYDQNRLTKANADEREHRAELVRMRAERMRGMLVEVKEVERGRIERIVAVKNAMAIMARKIAERIEGKDVEKIVQEEVDLCCDRFAGEPAAKDGQ